MKTTYDLLTTEWIGREGAGEICRLEANRVREYFSPAMLRRLEGRMPSREPDNRTPEEKRSLIETILRGDGAAAPGFREVSEGGIWNALWYLAEELSCGIRVDIDRIPIKQETIEVCELFGIHPYYLTGGKEVILAAVHHGEAMADRLRRQGIHAAVIGFTTVDHDRILRIRDQVRYLDRPKEDELVRFMNERRNWNNA